MGHGREEKHLPSCGSLRPRDGEGGENRKQPAEPSPSGWRNVDVAVIGQSRMPSCPARLDWHTDSSHRHP